MTNEANPKTNYAAHGATRHTPRQTMTNTASTLIEFPGTPRPQQPAWRKELIERVREIQERRAREAALEESATRKPHARSAAAAYVSSVATQQLGLVPTPAEDRALNPIVVAALRRVERARQPAQPLAVAAPAPNPAPPAERSSAQRTPKPAPPPAATVSRSVTAPRPTRAEQEHAEQERADAANASAPRAANVTDTQIDSTPDAQTRQEQPPQAQTQHAQPSRAQTQHIQTPRATVVPNAVDANSPAFLKHRQEEAARNNAKRLAAEQLAAPNARAAVTKTLTTSSERAASAAEVARHAPIDSPESTPENGLSKIDSDAANTATPIEIETTQPTAAIAPEGTTIEVKPAARRVIAEVLDEASIARREAEQAAVEAKRNRKSPDDYAPFASRLAAGAIDLIAIGFLSSPIAAALELGYGDWSGTGIRLVMALGVALIVFLYFTASVAFAGRTWGMSMLSLRAVDVETGMIPTVHQAARRGAAYVASLAFLGLGFLYALIDPEGRGAHDHLSGTVVVHD